MIMPRTLALLALVSALLGFTNSAHAQDETSYLKIIRLDRGQLINLRSGPGTQYRAVSQLAGGDVGIQEVARSGRWVKISYCGFEGWMSGSFLGPLGRSESPSHDCKRVGPKGLDSDLAAVGSLGLSGQTEVPDLQKIANDEEIVKDKFDLPIRKLADGRDLGALPAEDKFYKCVLSAGGNQDQEQACVNAATKRWDTNLKQTLALTKRLVSNRKFDQLRSTQKSWLNYTKRTCADFKDASAPVAVLGHEASCMLIKTRERTLELERLAVYFDSKCRLCERKTSE